MTHCSLPAIADQKTVGMGQIAIARGPVRLVAILGSCVGVACYHARMQLGALCHVVLPVSHARAGQPGKFADTAIPQMLEMLKREGALAAGLVAKITGGACMFGAGGPLQIGDDNAKAVLAALASAGVRVVAKDIGGASGRRIAFDCGTGKIEVSTAGNTLRTI
jgi:chemotaxis protein CheD